MSLQLKDTEIKTKLISLVEEANKTANNPSWFNGFEIIVENGIVSVEKNNIKSKKCFIYEDKAKDGNGYNWNLGALGNLTIAWENQEK